jgi:hypothetical protein
MVWLYGLLSYPGGSSFRYHSFDTACHRLSQLGRGRGGTTVLSDLLQYYLLSSILNYDYFSVILAFNKTLPFLSNWLHSYFCLFLFYSIVGRDQQGSLAVFNWLTRKLFPQVIQFSTSAFCSCSQHLCSYPPVELASKLRRLLGKENIQYRIQSKNLRIIKR